MHTIHVGMMIDLLSSSNKRHFDGIGRGHSPPEKEMSQSWLTLRRVQPLGTTRMIAVDGSLNFAENGTCKVPRRALHYCRL